MTRMTDERLAEIKVYLQYNSGNATPKIGTALILWDELKAERQRVEELEQELEAAEAKLAELERGEYICQKCGLRKDAEFTPGDF